MSSLECEIGVNGGRWFEGTGTANVIPINSGVLFFGAVVLITDEYLIWLWFVNRFECEPFAFFKVFDGFLHSVFSFRRM